CLLRHLLSFSTRRSSDLVNYFDHADLYGFNVPEGGYHLCERRFAEALKLSSAEREEIIVQSKTGIIDKPWGYDQSYEHIVASARSEEHTSELQSRFDLVC